MDKKACPGWGTSGAVLHIPTGKEPSWHRSGRNDTMPGQRHGLSKQFNSIPTMKTTTIAALIGASLASATFLAAPVILPRTAFAAEQAAPETTLPAAAPAPVNGIGQYKIMSLAPFQNDANTQRMEDALNKLAADGWRVETGVGIALVLSR